MNFLKIHSFGNDFIILNDARLVAKKNLSRLAKKLCDRHMGIGADGLLIGLPSRKADIRMRIINADGSEADMCGNGIRCFAKYVFEHGIINHKKLTIETAAGIIKPELTTRGRKVLSIKVDMGRPLINSNFIHYPLTLAKHRYHLTQVIMGVPHTILFVATLDRKEATQIGPLLENHKLFPQKTNVNFVKIVNMNELELLTWERGVGLSLACGSGACAAAVAAAINNKTKRNVTVHFGAGDLFIEWAQNNGVYMTGRAPHNICHGQVLLDE